MEQKNTQELILQYLELLRRGKYFLIVPLAIFVFLGTSVAFNLPKVYRSEAKMFYMQAQLPDWAKLEVINMYLEAMLVFIEAMTLSPDKIKKLINELDLYPDQEGKVPFSSMVDNFKKQFQITYDYTEVPSKYGRTEEIITGFSFSFDHSDSRKAYYVANALATSFIEGFRKFRSSSSEQSEFFFEAERERLRREMAVVDQRVSNFKQKHVNELPELFQLNYRMADSLANKLFQLEQKIMLLRSQRGTLETELSTLSPVLGMTGLSGERIVSPQERLAALQAELGQLQARFSERHPDVRRSKNEINELKALMEKEASSRDGRQVQPGNHAQDKDYVLNHAGGAFNPTYTQLRMRLDEVKADIEAIKLEKIEYEAELKEYQRRVGITPLVEKEWLILARDQESALRRFNDLAAQVQTMTSAAEMEKRELGGRLSIGQAPQIPLSPYKPNIPMIVGISIFLGLATGTGLLLGWDYLTKTVRTSQDLLSLQLPAVLVELPAVVPAGGTAERFKANKVYVRLAVVLLIISTIVAVDVFYMKVDVLIVQVLSKIQTFLALQGL